MSIYSDTSGFPPESSLLKITQAQFSARTAGPYGVSNGGLVLYVPPAQPAQVISLKTQAETLLKSQQAYVMQNYAIYGDETPTEWLTYLKALRAIANGTDTTSTTLPTAPATTGC